MKENRFDFSVFMAVIMLIVLIGGLLVGTVFGIVNNNQVAYADSVVPNLLPHTDYNVVFNNSNLSSGVPYAENLVIGGGFTVSGDTSGTTIAFNGGFLAFMFGVEYQLNNNTTYTFSVNVVDVQATGAFYLRILTTNSPFGGSQIQSSAQYNNGVVSYTFTTNSAEYKYLTISLSANSGNFIKFDKIKLEEGNSFTGWYTPEQIAYNNGYQAGFLAGADSVDTQSYYDDGYQSGYDAGFNAGLNSFAGRTNYQLIGNLGRVNDSALQDNPLLDLDFVFQNQHYTMLNSQNTPVQYEDGNTYSFYHPDGQWSLDYLPGVKVVSNLLFGNILISCPYWIGGSMFWQIVFEDTITGAVVYTDYLDTLHYKFVPSYSFQTNNQATTSGYPELDSWNFFDIEYFFENPQNIYFIPSRAIYNWDLASGDIVKYPTNSFFNIYSTQSQTALTSFDDGYQKGVEAGREGAVLENAQAVSNARAAGYEEGRRDALADSNDYTFVGLLGAVFDAPIKSFQGLLNFDVLGVNMQSFVLALLSLSVIIIIIKIALGGK